MDEPESSSFIGAEEEALHMEKVVAWNVKMLLTARRASQLALAEALGIKKAAMSRKINGYISWSLADVVKAARFLGTTPENLMDDTLMKNMTDAPSQGALIGAGSPRFLVSPFNPDVPVEGGISGAAKGALAGFVPSVVPSGSGSPASPSEHDGIGVSGRSQAHETLRAMTTIIMRTTEGDIKIDLFDDKTPETVANFLGLATGEKEWTDPFTGQPSHEPFYDGLTFHRIIKDFMIQGGCPLGNGTGGPGWNIKGEFAANGVNNPIKHVRGVISMARSMNPNSAGSQFFIMHKDAPHLDGQYAAFGKVVAGMDVVDKIASVPTDWNDKPKTPVKMKTVELIEG